MVISFEGVYYSYSERPGEFTLSDINLKIEDGALVAILGENGAGKTTLIKHINGLLKPQQGRVSVDGVDTRKSTVAAMARKVGLVFQNPDHQLFAETVEKELSFALVNFGLPAEDISRMVEWALKEFDLSPYKDRPPFLLSGGERKRLALASVLCYGPQILILDEPTTGQDNRQKVRLASLFRKLNSEGKTVIVVTHDMEFVADFIPAVVLLSHGRLLAEGPTREILVKRELLNNASLLPPQLVELSWDLSLKKPSLDLDEVTDEIMLAGRFGK